MFFHCVRDLFYLSLQTLCMTLKIYLKQVSITKSRAEGENVISFRVFWDSLGNTSLYNCKINIKTIK